MLLKYKSHIRIIQINVSRRIILAHINFRLSQEGITAGTLRSLRPFDDQANSMRQDNLFLRLGYTRQR